jgi:hypothetical protein
MIAPEQVQLLPCPFCGGEARFVDGRLSINIRCGNYDCGITQRQYYYETTAEAIAAWNTRHTATAEALEAMREAQHMASDLLQHIDWLTNGLPAMLENGGLTDEAGLIGAAVDTANSGRVTLTRLTAAIAKIEGQQP